MQAEAAAASEEMAALLQPMVVSFSSLRHRPQHAQVWHAVVYGADRPYG